MKVFYGGKFIEKSKLEEVGIFYPIKLEYYKSIDSETNKNGSYFGISIVKTEYKKDDVIIETKDLRNITQSEIAVDNLLNLFKENEVTPVNAQEIMYDLRKNILI